MGELGRRLSNTSCVAWRRRPRSLRHLEPPPLSAMQLAFLRRKRSSDALHRKMPKKILLRTKVSYSRGSGCACSHDEKISSKAQRDAANTGRCTREGPQGGITKNERTPMSIYKRGAVYWYKFMWNGELVRESTKQGNDKTARKMEAAHRTRLAEGLVGIRERKPAPTLKSL